MAVAKPDHGTGDPERGAQAGPRTAAHLRFWLGYRCSWRSFVGVLAGGATRLTNSGLFDDGVEADPRRRHTCRCTAAEWEEEFRLYQRIPEFQQLNSAMTVEEFKGIFWWEWAHRLIARGPSA